MKADKTGGECMDGLGLAVQEAVEKASRDKENKNSEEKDSDKGPANLVAIHDQVGEPDIIDVDAIFLPPTNLTEINVDLETGNLDPVGGVAIVTPELLSNVYEYTRAGKEFVSRDSDSRTRKQSIGKTFISTMRLGYGEIDLFHLQNWYHNLRFFPVITNQPDTDGNIWYFRLVIVHPKASELHRRVNSHYQKRIDGFLPLLKSFYEKAFSPTEEAVNSIALAVQNNISFMIVALKCPPSHDLKPFWKEDNRSLKIVAAISFLYCENPNENQKVDVYTLWLNVASNSMKPNPPHNMKGWRRQGFGLFLTKSMIKYCYAIKQNTKEVDVYLQCYELQAFHCFSMLGFVQINDKYKDGFNLLPKHLQNSLILLPSKSRSPGECLFIFHQSALVERVAYHLMVLRSGCLRHFKEEIPKKMLLSPKQKGNRENPLSSFWCQYPPPIVRGRRLEYSKKCLTKLYNGLPLVKALLPPPYDFTSPITSLSVKGEMSISNRLKHSQSFGKKWMATGEIDLMISTILWDGRYNDLCFVLPCTHSATIASTFDLYVKSKAAWKMHCDEIKNGISPNVLQQGILMKFGYPVDELRRRYQNMRDYVLKMVIRPNSGLMSRRVLIFPINEGEAHWSVTFVFNPSFIDEQYAATVPGNVLRPCFLRYCSQRPDGRRNLKLSSGIVWFLNLCYSSHAHEKKHGVLSSEKVEFQHPFGSETDGCMHGTNRFPSLHLPVGNNYLPEQIDDFNCGIGACAGIAIILRDVVLKDMQQQHDPANQYDECFCVRNLSLKECPSTKEVFCNMPEHFFEPLPTKEKLIWGDYLTMVREQWFLLLDRLAHLQYVTEPTSIFNKFEVSKVYVNNVEAIVEWPQVMNSTLRRAATKTMKTLQAKDSYDMSTNNELHLVTHKYEEPSNQQETKTDVVMTDNSKGMIADQEAMPSDVAMRSIAKEWTILKSDRSQSSNDNTNAGGSAQPHNDDALVNKGQGSKLFDFVKKHQVFLNGECIPIMAKDVGKAEVQTKIAVTRPVVFTSQRVKRPLKRKPDPVELQAERVLQKIKVKDPRAGANLEQARLPVEKSKLEICTQSAAMCDAIAAEYGTELPAVNHLQTDEYNNELEQYIENSFIEWKWHSNAAHEREIKKWSSKLNNAELSDKTKKHICLMIKALRAERSKYRNYFAEQFMFTQKTLVRSVKFVEENNTFVALLVWTEEVPVYADSNRQNTEQKVPRKPDRYQCIEREDEIRVDKHWVKDQFGVKMYQHVINMRQDPHHAWVQTPRDVDVYIGKHKVVRVRYVPERLQWIVDTQKLNEAVQEEELVEELIQGNGRHETEHVATETTKLRPGKLVKGLQRIAPKSSAKIVRSNEAKPVVEETQLDTLEVLDDLPRKSVTVPARWSGKTINGKTVSLDEDFVRMSFGNAFSDELKKSNRGFVDIPVGDYKASHLNEHPNLKVIGGLVMKYVHSEGKDLCITKSLASAFFAIGWHEQSAKIDVYGEVILGGLVVQALDRVVNYTKTLFPRWVHISMIPRNFEWTTDLLPNDVMIGVLKASDGSCSHAVTIHGNFVFDANESVVLPLCEEALDYCTSTAKVKSSFVGFKRGFIYRYQGFQEKKIARMTLTEQEGM